MARNVLKSAILAILVYAILFVNVGATYSVYITNTGIRYHKSECTSLENSCHEIEINEAKRRGYTPCELCSPPLNEPSVLERIKMARESNGVTASTQDSTSVNAKNDNRSFLTDSLTLIVYKNSSRANTYHRAGCPNISDDALAIEFDELTYNDTQCALCNPPEKWTQVGVKDTLPYIPTTSYIIAVGLVIVFAVLIVVLVVKKNTTKKSESSEHEKVFVEFEKLTPENQKIVLQVMENLSSSKQNN